MGGGYGKIALWRRRAGRSGFGFPAVVFCPEFGLGKHVNNVFVKFQAGGGAIIFVSVAVFGLSVFVIVVVIGLQQLPVMVSARDCLLIGLHGGIMFSPVEFLVLPSIHDAGVSQERPECERRRVVFRFFIVRGRGGVVFWADGRLNAGVVGKGLTLPVEDGLLVVGITENVKV